MGFVAMVPDRQSQHRRPNSRKHVNTIRDKSGSYVVDTYKKPFLLEIKP